MHIGEIKTSIVLDMASPVAALVVSKFLASLASDIDALCDSLTRNAPDVVSEAQSGCFSWRMDTYVAEKSASSDPIISWIEKLSDAGAGQDTSLSASDYYLPTSSPTVCSDQADCECNLKAMPPRITKNSMKTQTEEPMPCVLLYFVHLHMN